MSERDYQIGEDQHSSIGRSLGKEGEAEATVFFNQNCFFCRQLAQFIGKLSSKNLITLMPSREENPESLVVQPKTDPQQILIGEAAWSWLLEHHSALKQVHWLAEKIGAVQTTSRLFQQTTSLLRKVCRTC